MIDQDIIDRAIEVRRHLHQNPELSNQETETQAFIQRELARTGLEQVRVAAGTGVAVDIVGSAGPSNRKIAIRADIDALPIVEESGVTFSSKRQGVMHACGHDAHTAMVLATAAGLHRHRNAFRGTVRLIFQPAEEAEPLGGRRVLAEGLLEDVDGAIGIHVDPYLETGKIAVAPGSYTLAADGFDIIIKGASAHAAKPQEGVDAIAIGCAIVSEIQKIVSREADVLKPLIISVTTFSGGGSYNVIADQVLLKGTVRSGDQKSRDMAHRRLEEIVTGVARLHRGEAELRLVKGEPPVENDAEMAALVERTAKNLRGEDAVMRLPGWTAADDFGFYSAVRPSVYFRLGVRNENKGAAYPLHHPKFSIDEDAIPFGVETLVGTALAFLENS
ncbi:MAG TPA: amidohydrolase [Aestuariivirgaceae bacterium]